MRFSLKRLAPVTAVTAAVAAAALVPAAGASAAPAPLPISGLAALALPAAAGLAGLPASDPSGNAAPSLVFQGPQVAIGPTVIGSVFNGGTAIVVATDQPVDSGNVIGSP